MKYRKKIKEKKEAVKITVKKCLLLLFSLFYLYWGRFISI